MKSFLKLLALMVLVSGALLVGFEAPIKAEDSQTSSKVEQTSQPNQEPQQTEQSATNEEPQQAQTSVKSRESKKEEQAQQPQQPNQQQQQPQPSKPQNQGSQQEQSKANVNQQPPQSEQQPSSQPQPQPQQPPQPTEPQPQPQESKVATEPQESTSEQKPSSEKPELGRFFDFAEIPLEALLNQEIETASAKKEKVSEAPAITTLLSASWLNNLGVRDLNEAMSFVPGVVVADTYWRGPIITFRGVRMSLYNDKVLLLLNGIPMYEAVNSSYFIESIPLEAVKRIEIIRGPGSALYGSGAFAGVINVITRQPKDYNCVGAKIGLGSFKTVNGAVYGGKEFTNGIGVALALSYKNDEGYSHPIKDEKGVVDDVNYENDVFNSLLVLSYKNYVKLYAGYFDQRQNKFGMIPVHGYGGLAVHRKAFVALRGGYEPEEGLYVGTWTRFDYMDRKTNVGLFAASDEYPAPNYSFYKGSIVEADLWGGFKKDKLFSWLTDFDIRLGVSYLLRMVDNVYTMYDDEDLERLIEGFEGSTEYPPPDINDFALYGQLSATLFDAVGLIAGVRYTYLDMAETWHLTPRGGIVLKFIPNTSIKVLYGKAYRSPSVFEGYINVGNVLFGNTPLDPETIDTIEGSISYLVEPIKLSITANGFYMWVSDLIGRRPLTDEELSQQDKPWSGSKPGSMVYDNIGDSRYYGGELELVGSPLTWLHFFVNAGYVDGTEKQRQVDPTTGETSWSEETDIPFIAHITANGGISASFANRFIATLAIQYVGSREGTLIDPDTKQATIPYEVDGYTLVKANLRLKLPAGFEASLTINNLLDTEYYYPEAVRRNIGKIPGGAPLSVFFSVAGEWSI